jgi:hypothetical protein
MREEVTGVRRDGHEAVLVVMSPSSKKRTFLHRRGVFSLARPVECEAIPLGTRPLMGAPFQTAQVSPAIFFHRSPHNNV